MQTSPVNNSLDRLLETLPGVVQFSYNEPVINGFHGVTYNIDGAPLPLATTSNFAEIMDPKIIDSIEVLTGAIPAEYGGDRMGGVVNIISNRPSDIPEGTFGTVTAGFGNQGQGVGTLDLESRSGQSEFFLSGNTYTTDSRPRCADLQPDQRRGLELERVLPLHHPTDAPRQLGFRLFESIFAVPNSDQHRSEQSARSRSSACRARSTRNCEYDRFANLNWTQTSQDGNGIFQVIPWWRSTRIDY